MVIPIVIGAPWIITKIFVQRPEELEIRWQVETIQTKIGQNTEKSPGDLRRFAVTQTPRKIHQQMQPSIMWSANAAN